MADAEGVAPPAVDPAVPADRGGGGGGASDSDGERAVAAPAAAGVAGVGLPWAGRPDLSADEITRLRERQRELKQEQRRVKNEMKNKKRRRARVIARLRHLDTASVMQVLLERGLDVVGAPGAPAGPPAADAAAAEG